MRTAKQIFEEELSGEPLSQDIVECVIELAMKEAIKECAKVAKTKLIQTVSQPYGDTVYERIVNKDSILDLIKKLL